MPTTYPRIFSIPGNASRNLVVDSRSSFFSEERVFLSFPSGIVTFPTISSFFFRTLSLSLYLCIRLTGITIAGNLSAESGYLLINSLTEPWTRIMAAREEKGSPSFLAEIAISRASANTFFHREEKPKGVHRLIVGYLKERG